MKKLIQQIKRASKKNAVYSQKQTKVNDSFSNMDITKADNGFAYPSSIFTLK